MKYGYARKSRPTQNIERQIRNIKAVEPGAVIVQETYTGTRLDRPEWSKLNKKLIDGDTVIFDSVSRMSRDAEEGFALYEALYNRGVELVFLKEPYINTSVYREAAQRRIEAAITTGNKAMDEFTRAIIEAVNKLLMDLAKQQITTAFEQAEKEVQDLHQRTKEGIETIEIIVFIKNLSLSFPSKDSLSNFPLIVEEYKELYKEIAPKISVHQYHKLLTENKKAVNIK